MLFEMCSSFLPELREVRGRAEEVRDGSEHQVKGDKGGRGTCMCVSSVYKRQCLFNFLIIFMLFIYERA